MTCSYVLPYTLWVGPLITKACCAHDACTHLATLWLHPSQGPSRPLSSVWCVQMLEATEGYQLLEQRRRSKFDKQIANGVLLSKGGMDEGVDRNLKVF